MNLFDDTSFECSKVFTTRYSTSFSKGIMAFDKRFRAPIYAIYGYVRCADEIVDTFHDHDKRQLMANFRADTYIALRQGISLNPILHAFQKVVKQYSIEEELINAFLCSMEMDLDLTTCTDQSYEKYIYGSAEVVGLMCLRVFCENNAALYDDLRPMARSLGSAFQKVNFLRDVKADLEERGRTYFPLVDLKHFSEADKQQIEANIRQDFDDAYEGIKRLPKGTRLGVYIAYTYYRQLFEKICRTPANVILQKRIRVSDTQKLALYFKALVQQKLNVI